jgi:putative aminopeptidase FrvX
MPTLPQIDEPYLMEFLSGLLLTPSPTGFAHKAVRYTENALAEFPFINLRRTRKGALIAEWPDSGGGAPCAITAHVDTLGAMVKEIKSNGRLKMTPIGGFAWNTVEGEGCTVFTSKDKHYRGSILLTEASGHVYGKDVNDLKRENETMEVRLDTQTESASDTRALGIAVGDFIAFDPRLEISNGFVRSRHLDDKACVACILGAIKSITEAGLSPSRTVYFLISNYEEVGHGAAAGIPPEVEELLAVDMAAVGDGQTSDEYHASICVKDSGGPYHFGFSQKMRALADKYEISHKVDIYPYYGSDGEAFWRAGGDVAVALIGPGVDASHSYERTHMQALMSTTQWIMAYLLDTGEAE